ncbi:SARP family transcriptional regulator [Ensifer sp. T173]|jgi:tetratricopeptide (TPR) repeat protein|uniref:SARP family transcriptional regulator n=1 Tax=Ensifer canadensis TaxID=555315 RepID=A0AAW4FIM0_9HYPH|nr:SARP family transcriptional regulator [Ensifer canadensis]MBM3091953.1 SARP family transcriptional regulator [Ensifer canadensis]UBI78036.1 SARP family transcriptional regulator [Ensifer canadensis]
MKFRLQTLGRLRLVDEDDCDVAFPEKGLLILAQAIAGGHREQSRNDVAKLLWNEVVPSQAFVNLRKTISRITSRQEELGHTFLSFSPSTVRMQPDSIASDLDDIGRNAEQDALSRFQWAGEKFRDDFLKDLKSQGRALHDWIEQRRADHAALLRECLINAAEIATGPDRKLVRSAAVKLLEKNPDDDEVRKILKTVLTLEGRHYDTRLLSGGGLVAATAKAALPSSLLETMGETRPPRVVLLPPGAGNADAAATLFAHSLIEDVTIGLCALRSVSVIAPYTAAQISLQADKASTYEQHAISYILDTRLTNEGSRQTLFTQLIFFANDEVIWADRFTLDDDGLMRSRQEIARQIAFAIASQVERNETMRKTYESNGSSYRSYLLGQRYLKQLNLPEVRRARKSFREALSQNADLAPAMSGLARSYFVEWLLTARGDSELLALAEQHARDAIAIDDTLAAGYRELGVVKLYSRQFDESIEFHEKAEALSPQHANVIASYADTLVQASRPDGGLRKIEAAINLNPMAPDEYFWTAAGACYSLSQYDQALDYIERMRDPTPADRLAAASWGMLGNRKKAGQYVRKTFEVHPDFNLDKWIAIVPFREEWQRTHYCEGLRKAGF